MRQMRICIVQKMWLWSHEKSGQCLENLTQSEITKSFQTWGLDRDFEDEYVNGKSSFGMTTNDFFFEFQDEYSQAEIRRQEEEAKKLRLQGQLLQKKHSTTH